ncbi:MauE/DoxX family redox-associated membrane protein [Confluentibacter sediminis]|uniref:MauE/DoxX family redox-associated membrane protein n=1 Tax=Confluentibacter sediminis TaxID=2219045 RepID=UPI000DADD565|nr:MauE/DoxX family redox-associated membrane protein [Confluentibacter sediminis]
MVRNKSWHQIVTKSIVFLYVVLFVYAATSKLLDFENFRLQLSQSLILTDLKDIIAFMIPLLEILIAIGLAINQSRMLALYMGVGLMSAFTMYIVTILNFSDFVPCSCGGILEQLGWKEHLVFNFIFVALGSFAIIINAPNVKKPNYTGTAMDKKGFKRTLFQIGTLIILVCGLVLGLFFYTDYKNHLPGSFIRTLPPHPISEIKNRITLEENQFQFAGITKNHIYLNRKNNPFEILQFDYTLSKSQTIHLNIPKPYKFNPSRVGITINDLGVFITDGTTPILFKGNTNNWVLEALDLKNNYFNSATPMDVNLLAITKLIPKEGRLMGILNMNKMETYLNPLALQKQADIFFSTDGFMHYNPDMQKLIYTYYYRNEYLLINKSLKVTARFKTIDTTSTAKLKLSSNKKNDQMSLAMPPPLVNRRSFSQGHWLFNQSITRAKNELQIVFQTRSVIDVYNLKNGNYAYSFYIPHIEGHPLKDFIIKHNQIYILYTNQLIRRELIQKYLPSQLPEIEHQNILHVETGM